MNDNDAHGIIDVIHEFDSAEDLQMPHVSASQIVSRKHLQINTDVRDREMRLDLSISKANGWASTKNIDTAPSQSYRWVPLDK